MIAYLKLRHSRAGGNPAQIKAPCSGQLQALFRYAGMTNVWMPFYFHIKSLPLILCMARGAKIGMSCVLTMIISHHVFAAI
jgi:hypothetical protein